MVEKNSKSKKFIDYLLNFQDIKDLELCDDQGVKVSTHTYDVLNISINKIKEKYVKGKIYWIRRSSKKS